MDSGAPSSSTAAAAAARAWLEQHSQSLGLFTNGKFVCPVGRRTHAVTDSKGGTVCSLVCAEDEDISSCASSAAAGFKAWGELSGHRRAKVLLRLASTLQRYTQCVSELCDLCQSPCPPSALVRLAQYYAGWAQLRDTLMPEWTPRGVIAVVVSEDCSFYSIWIKVFPALAMGNAVIVVPGAKLAPPALLLAQLFMEAGLPAGALSVVTGDGSVGAKVAQNNQISYLTYSGSQQDGEVFSKQTAGWGLPVSVCLSVSAMCPFIIFESADLDSAVDAVIEAELNFTGCFGCPSLNQKVAGLMPSTGRRYDHIFSSFNIHGEGALKQNTLCLIAHQVLRVATPPLACVCVCVCVIFQFCNDDALVPRSCFQYVGGKLCKADSGSSRTVQSPGGAVLAHCPDGGRKDVRNAVEAALKVQPGWMKKSPAARALSLYSLSDNLEKRKLDMATSIHAQTGISIEEAEKEVEISITRLSDWAARCDKQTGGMLLLPQTGSALSAPEALGVVGVVLPDTKPLLSLVSLLGAAVSVGNAVIMVPSEKHPLPALDFIQVLQASDIPAGLISVLTGGRNQLTHALANHSEIQAVWYWGSMEGCQFLQHTCCSPLKRLWLHCEEEEAKDGGKYWSHPSPSVQEEMWREAVVWKSVWIPTA
uniref:Aldehyde dehydrogenase 16 family, member A1 n=1 Tax=Astyanax mexicanus TaxID=7994 RepID=A0A8B9L5X9_ASTMX